MLLLGYLSPSRAIKSSSNFVDINDKVEADTWEKVSKGVRSGDELDMFTEDYARNDPNPTATAQL